MKSKEQLEKEQQEAKEKLEQMMAASRPKNFREGVGGGVSNILAGAVGAAGVAVVAPTVSKSDYGYHYCMLCSHPCLPIL